MPRNKRSPFSLSTSWNYRNHKKARPLVDEIKNLGFDAIELNFALAESAVEDIAAMVQRGYVSVSSAHNFCPIPSGTPLKKASPDYYSLASMDEAERKKAVFFTKRTVCYAKKLGAKAVMLHTGKIGMKDMTKKMGALIGKGDRAGLKEIKEKASRERNSKMAPYLENVLKSLGEIIPFAGKNGIMLAVENRFYHSEVPSFEELESIFKAFPAGDLFYWHDVGHAQIYEILGFRPHEDYLRAFSNRLIGAHFHDIMFPTQDHLAPGTGIFDFRRIKQYIKADTIKVIEVHRPVTAEEIVESVKFLKEVFYD